jgi:hypothetical protein
LYPNDEHEQTRLDEQHEILNQLHGRLFFAPLDPDEVRSVLDIGTGTVSYLESFKERGGLEQRCL